MPTTSKTVPVTGLWNDDANCLDWGSASRNLPHIHLSGLIYLPAHQVISPTPTQQSKSPQPEQKAQQEAPKALNSPCGLAKEAAKQQMHHDSFPSVSSMMQSAVQDSPIGQDSDLLVSCF